jgi:hypothetical protein
MAMGRRRKMSTLTTKFSNSEQWESEPLPAIFLDVEDVLQRHCSVIDDTAKGVADLEPDANPTEKKAARRVDAMKDQGRAADRVWQELKERVGVQRGTNCELDADDSTMTKEDKLEQHEDAMGDFMKQWMELIHSKEAQEIGLAG